MSRRDRIFRIGTAGWVIPAGVRDRFPVEGTALERYAQRLPVTEINSTFSRSHKRQTYERWATAVPDEFQFAVKVPKSVTHHQRLVDVDILLDRFLEEVAALGTKLGPLLIQLPPSLVFDVSIVRKFLECIRRRASRPLVCEPRHSSWFLGEAHQLLSDYEVARVAADPARVPEAALPGGSNSIVYYRLHGSPRMYYSEYGAAYARELASRLTAPVAPETWCIFDNTTSGAATLDALALQEQVGEELGRRSQGF
jgi:uncharacterized protein YecE (DUF72 family)